MFEQDYLVRLLMQFFEGICRALRRGQEDDPQGAADILEQAVGQAIDMDGALLLSLSPESMAQVMQVSGIDSNVTQFVARSLLLESVYLQEAGRSQLASVRSAQARSIAAAYGFGLPDDPSDFEAITAGLEEAASGGGFASPTVACDESVAGDPFAALFGGMGDSATFDDNQA